eukprot:TRINITY_DN1212_c0_g1_i1.p2 TRINITY_DN1212_c0_g1~~TRINITY_DN1212_c0_g1_i1.p2  ORF type:complete len:93 (-),score=3.79 TRINITY_DN1212_c0_g1_i1:124-402(-)
MFLFTIAKNRITIQYAINFHKPFGSHKQHTESRPKGIASDFGRRAYFRVTIHVFPFLLRGTSSTLLNLQTLKYVQQVESLFSSSLVFFGVRW